ncbi:MAG TPA: hypothetical protein VKD90_08325 [Gemmataceae bacterium]|nr:hypothetical protein [Gemmataceae bacterium]
MAHFFQKPGTAGTWVAATHSLTITLGEVAQVILEGGGPPGKERLDVGCVAGVTDERGELPPIGNQRFFLIAPKAAGETWYFAKIPGTSEDYAEPLRLITLPRKASSLGVEHIVVLDKGARESDKAAVRRRAVGRSPEEEVAEMGSIADFVNFLRRLRDAGRRVGSMEFFTHGSPGQIGFGKESFGVRSVQYMDGQGYNTIFAPNARIFFAGCTVAKDYRGIIFLKEFGRVFLLNGGGSVAGTDSVGFSYGVIGFGKMYHPWGQTRRLYFNTAGQVEKWEGMDGIDLSCIDVRATTAKGP